MSWPQAFAIVGSVVAVCSMIAFMFWCDTRPRQDGD